MNRKVSPLRLRRGTHSLQREQGDGQGHKCMFTPEFRPQAGYRCLGGVPPNNNRKLFITTTTVLPS